MKDVKNVTPFVVGVLNVTREYNPLKDPGQFKVKFYLAQKQNIVKCFSLCQRHTSSL